MNNCRFKSYWSLINWYESYFWLKSYLADISSENYICLRSLNKNFLPINKVAFYQVFQRCEIIFYHIACQCQRKQLNHNLWVILKLYNLMMQMVLKIFWSSTSDLLTDIERCKCYLFINFIFIFIFWSSHSDISTDIESRKCYLFFNFIFIFWSLLLIKAIINDNIRNQISDF